MAGRFFDESDVRIRPKKRGSRPRTKTRPSHDEAEYGMVITKDRGRWGVVLDRDAHDDDPVSQAIVCMRAREMGRTPIVVGDRVGIVGDTSGAAGSLARIVKLQERATELRRTADDTDPYERIVIANATRLVIVTAVTDPPPRTGFVERALVAAYAGGLSPIVVLTKTDLADPGEFTATLGDVGVPVITAGVNDPLDDLHAAIDGHVSTLIGHSGVGKSTLVNRLVPGAGRATGEVSGVGKGRHTSTQSVALPLAAGGWIIDTPGIRSFGLAHIEADTVINVFDDLRDAAAHCPRGCRHGGPDSDPGCALDELTGASGRRAEGIRRILTALRSRPDWES